MTPVKAGVHMRENRSVTAEIEKKALVWMAERLPRAINSDHLSAVGFSAMAAAGAAFAAMRYSPWAAGLVVLFLAVNWFGDSLDGTLARVRGHQRPRYGYYLDHVIDIAGTTLLFAGIGYSGLMTPVLALALLVAYLLVSAEVYLATHATGTFRMSYFGFGPTELRIVLAMGAVKAAYAPSVGVAATSALLFDVGGLVAIAGLAVSLVVGIVRNGRALYAAEPLPARESRVA